MNTAASPPGRFSPERELATRWVRRGSHFTAALLARGLTLVFSQDNPFFVSPVIDAQTYHELAQAIAEGSWTEGRAFWQPPLYPFLLGLLYWLVGPSIVVARGIQAVLGSLTCVMVGELGARFFGSRVGWISGFLLALYGPAIFFDGELLAPVLSLALDTAALLVLLPGADQALSWRRLLSAGVLLGLSAIARPTILLFALAVGGWWLWHGAPERSSGRRRTDRLSGLAALGLGLAAPIAPVTLHNGLVGGEWILISSNGGINLFLGNHPDLDKGVRVRPGIAWKALMREPVRAGARGEAAASRFWTQRVIQDLKEHPGAVLLLQVRKAWMTLQAWEHPRNVDYVFFSRRHAPWLMWGVQFGALLPLAALGIRRSWRDPRTRLLLLFLGTQALSLVIFFVSARYRLSLVPVLAIYGGLGAEALISAGRHRERGLLLRSAAGVALVGGLIQADPYGVARVDEAEGYNLEGKAHSNARRRLDAIQAFEQALSLQPDLEDARFNLGREWQLQGRCDLALSYYEIVRETYPHDRDTLSNLGLCRMALGQPSSGILLLEQVQALYPDDVDVYYNLGQAYWEQDRAEAAIKIIQDALTLAPHSAPLRITLQTFLQEDARRRQTAAALGPLLQRARRRDSELRSGNPSGTGRSGSREELRSGPGVERDPELRRLNDQGHALLRSGQTEAAREVFLRVLSRSPDYAVAWSNLGQVLYQANDRGNARAAFDLALELKPGYWNARLGLAFLQSRSEQERHQARATLEAAILEAPEPIAERASALLNSFPDVHLDDRR